MEEGISKNTYINRSAPYKAESNEMNLTPTPIPFKKQKIHQFFTPSKSQNQLGLHHDRNCAGTISDIDSDDKENKEFLE